MNLPPGTTLYIGPPANPLPPELQAKIAYAISGVPGIGEAHLPQCYSKGLVDPSAQILVLVLNPGVTGAVQLREQMFDGFVFGGGDVDSLRGLAGLAREFHKPYWIQTVGTSLRAAWLAHLASTGSDSVHSSRSHTCNRPSNHSVALLPAWLYRWRA